MGPKYDPLLDNLLADLRATSLNMERVRLMLTDALVAPSAADTRKKAREARHTMGSALQTLQLAIDEVKRLRSAEVH
jgi:hypothetical protein